MFNPIDTELEANAGMTGQHEFSSHGLSVSLFLRILTGRHLASTNQDSSLYTNTMGRRATVPGCLGAEC